MSVEFENDAVLPPIHPGEVLREEFLVPLGLSAGAVAKACGVPRTRIERIVAEEVGISTDTAMRLAQFLGTTPQLWLNLQQRFELETLAREEGAEIARIAPARAAEEIGAFAHEIRQIEAETVSKELAPAQGTLDLQIEKQAEVQGIGMGVLRDGTPFLNQRGRARLCGVQNAHIGTIDRDWNDNPSKPRVAIIKQLLATRGIEIGSPSIDAVQNGRAVHAYTVSVCLAILEYYALDAGSNCQPEARQNFRLLAGKGLTDFIYTQVGYSPDRGVPAAWRQFHDRVTHVYNNVPHGYFGVFKEIADLIVTMIRGGAPVGADFVPDISVGQHWSRYWKEAGLAERYGDRIKYLHEYPDYFPQSASNPQQPFCYPDAALGEFRKWMRINYLHGGKFAAYLGTKEREGKLPPSFAQLAIKALETDQPKALPAH